MDGSKQVPLRLRLYINGQTAEAEMVELNLRRIFEDIGLVYEVEILDVRDHPERAEADRVVLTPTLIRLTPPEMRVAGDLTDTEAALDGLGLRVWEQRHNGPPANQGA